MEKMSEANKTNKSTEKQIQELMEKSVEQELIIDTILENTNAGFWDWNFKDDIITLSDSYLSQLGYNKGDLPNKTSDLREIIHPDDHSKLSKAFEEHMVSSEKVPFSCIARFFCKDGSIKWIQSKGKIISKDEKGSPLRMIGCNTDLTESTIKILNFEKEHEDFKNKINQYDSILKKAEERMQVFNEAGKITNFGTWSLNIKSGEIEWSDETYRIYEVPIGEKITISKVLDLLPPKAKEIVRDRIGNIDYSKIDEYQTNLLKIDRLEHSIFTTSGELKYVEIAGKIIVDDDNIFIQGSIQDITERKKAENDIHYYQRGLEFLNEIASNIDLSYDEQIQIALQKVCDYLQLPLGIISKINDEDYEVIYFHSDDPNFAIDPGTIFPLGQTFCSVVMKTYNTVAISYVKNSKYSSHPCYDAFKLESYISSPVYVNGKVYGTINFSSPEPKREGFSKYDIQFIKMLANWAGSTFGRLQNEEKLIEAKKKAEEASIAKEQFLSTMSHEIRTPMNAVIGMSHLLMQDNPQQHQVEKIKTLKFSAENLLSLINDILDINKIESGMISFEEIDFDLFELLNGIKHALKIKAEEKNIKLKIKYDNDIPTLVLGDPTRLSQILINLVGNALKFTEEGFVSVEVEVLQETDFNIDINFTIEDSGIGIPKHKMEMIFERFSQANGEITRKFGGSGLGLSIVKNLVELQGSEVSVESEEGKGSKFSFTLRFKKPQNALASHKSTLVFTHEEKDLGGIRILVVEDNAVNQLVASEFLGKWNTNITFADNGLIALEKIEQEEFDIILMDLQMPEMDGYEATKRIRQHPDENISTIPIIALTASVMIKVKEKVVQTGFNEYITKPFNPNELYLKIKKLSRKASYPLIGSSEVIETENTIIDSQTESNQPVINNENIISFEKLEEMADGNESFKTAIINQLKSDTEEFRNLIAEAVENQSEEKVSFAVHWFQTSLELFSLEELKTTIRNFREKLKDHQGDTPYYLAGLEEINVKIDEVLKAIK
ncbi:ATP-binding protein [Chondrinema litorale]|uniref:ATP-binding protein n=1 Tax=Chondrinema litorale TaxID=2994555 RepID=UPI0025437DB8|nr:ATP-binding protein [Chondrinema litorale]UZR97663.1 ATP-binding protein [Chondrinema litorale]